MSATGAAPARMPVRWSLSDGSVEALKWLAFAAMLLDHANIILYGRTVGWMYEAGRLAMPIFAVVFGYNLSRSRDPGRVLGRLWLVGLTVHPLVFFTINRGEVFPLNILLTFAAGGALVRYADRREWVQFGVIALAALLVVDYSIVGAGMVAASWAFFRSRNGWWLVLGGVLFAGLNLLNGNDWALAGLALVVLAGWVPVPCPRARWAFLVAYPAHMVVLWVLAL